MARQLDDGTWEVRGIRLTFPVRIGDAAAACALYPVRAARAQQALVGTGLTARVVAGWSVAAVALLDYRVNDLGTYREVALAFPVTHGGSFGIHITQLPVTAEFTCEAGRALWGLPKWLGDADLEFRGSRATGVLGHAGKHVLTAAISAPLRVPGTIRGAVTAYAPRDDVLLATPVRARLRGLRFGAGASLVLGSGHPMAAQLRALALPRRPLATAVIDHLAFDLDPAAELSGEPPARP